MEIASILNEHFVNIAEKVTDHLPKDAIHVIPTKLIEWVASKTPDGVTFNIPLMIINEVMKAFKTIDDKKATGADDLSAKYLKAAASSICIQLTHIINKVFYLINLLKYGKWRRFFHHSDLVQRKN